MVEDGVRHDETVKSSRRGVVTAVLLLVLVFGLLAIAYAFMGGDELVADLLGGAKNEPVVVTPTKPSTPSTETTDTATTDNTSTAEVPGESTEPTPTATDTSGGTTGGTTTPAVKPPTADQAARMYWEQVASQEQIVKLVNGEVVSVSFGTVSKSGTTANVPITVSYKAGGSLSGTMVLRNYSGVWYFSSIARSGGSLAVETGKAADLGIVSTIVSNQAANQAIVVGIVNGTYKKCTVNSVSGGSGTATVNITVGGGTAPSAAGSIVCVSKTISGTKTWFITSFTKN
ncbi:MAG: hypothetical protein CVT59_00200 [Actinobacteria bacterium HGW-Actinobacteria-1]|nr:MAG: hypothetical protein CVT59_00200 [Actinobacteria bacterium HGW-Actinobacteria-1]